MVIFLPDGTKLIWRLGLLFCAIHATVACDRLCLREMDQVPFACCVRDGIGYFVYEVQKFVSASVAVILSNINAGIKLFCSGVLFCLSLVQFFVT